MKFLKCYTFTLSPLIICDKPQATNYYGGVGAGRIHGLYVPLQINRGLANNIKHEEEANIVRLDFHYLPHSLYSEVNLSNNSMDRLLDFYLPSPLDKQVILNI